jgi:phage-related protein
VASIADAYVELHVDGDNLDGEVRASVRDTEPGAGKESDKVGRSLGSRLAAGFLTGFTKKIKSGGSKVGAELKKAFSGFNPKGLMIPALAAAIPFITSSLSALTGAAVAFTGAVVQAGGASLSFVGVLGSLVQAKLVATLAFKDFTKAVAGDEEALKKMSPAARAAAKAVSGLAGQWDGVRKAVQQNVFAGLDGVISRVAKATLPLLRSRLADTGTQLNLLFKDVGRFVQSEGFVRRFGKALQGNNEIFATLRKAAVPVLDGVLRVFRALQPSGQRLAGIILNAAKSFQAWASAPGFVKRIGDFMDRAFKSAGNLWGIIRNLGTVIRNVFGAATPAGAGLLKTLNDLTKRLADFTSLASSRNAIAEWAETGIQVTGRLFSVLGKIGAALLPLFNPSIANGYLSVFEKVIPVITSIVKVVQGALQPVLAGIGDAFAENGPKFAALFSALAPLLKGVGAVIGELIKQTIGTLGIVAAALTPVVKAVSNFLGPIMERFAPIIAGVIFAFTGWASVLIRMIPVVGRFLGPLAKLAEWIWKGVGPAFKFFGKIAGLVMKGVSKVFSAFGKFLGGPVKAYWNGLTLTVKLAFQTVKNVVSTGWRFVKTIFSTVLKVIGTVVRTYFNIYKTIVVTVFRIIRTVIQGAWKAISAVVRVGVSAVRSVISAGFNAARNIVSNVWSAVRGLTSDAWAKIYSFASSGVERVIGLLRAMPGKILNLASDFLNAGKELGSRVIDGIGDGLRAAGGFVSDLAGSIKGAINSALGLPITIKGPGPLPDFTIPAFARGGISPGGVALVGERGPELVNLPRGSRVHSNEDSRRMVASAAGGGRYALTITNWVTGRGYIERIADDRIEAADSLSWQGA